MQGVQITKRQVKILVAGLVKLIFERAGMYIDFLNPKSLVKPAKVTYKQIRNLFDAAEIDRVGRFQGVYDPDLDIGDISDESWERQVRRSKHLWKSMFPKATKGQNS